MKIPTLTKNYILEGLFLKIGTRLEILQAEEFLEMSNYLQTDTGLPANIWVDTSKSYIKGRHAKRIKFQINTKPELDINNSCPMLFDGTISEKIRKKNQKNKEFKLSSSQINEISTFVKNNSYLLDKACDALVSQKELYELFIKGGNPASERQKTELKHKVDAIISKKGGAMALIEEMIQEENEDSIQPKSFHSIEEMAKLGAFRNIEIMVFENEGKIPHFHFRERQSNKKGCIKLLANEYFKHGIYQEELNRSERKALAEFLKSEPKEQYKKIFKPGLTNYDVLCLLWDMNNDDNICAKKGGIPDYVNMR